MEVMTRPASPPPPQDFRFDSAATSPYATAPSSPRGRGEGGLFLTAPPSPDPFNLLPPATPRLTGANPFDLFQHFTSAPASPRRAAAIYAHFAEGSDAGGEEFEQRAASYSTAASAVPFEWEERPGTPKAGVAWDTDFEFGTVLGKTAPAEELTTADELFEKGRIRPLKPTLKTADELSDKSKIRPLKPPPGLLDGGSVASSPRSPMTRAGMFSPRRRSKVGSGVDFDPFAVALLEASKAPSPSPPGDDGGVASGSPLKNPKKLPTRPASRSAGWRKWPLSDLLLFRSSSEGRRVSKDPTSKCSPVQQPGTPAENESAHPTATTKANGKAGNVGKPKKQTGSNGAAAAEGVVGCARLSPLQRLAKGLGGYSWYYGRGMAAPATKG